MPAEPEAASLPASLERGERTLTTWYHSFRYPSRGTGNASHFRTAGIDSCGRSVCGGVSVVKTVAAFLLVCTLAWNVQAAEDSGHVQINPERIFKQTAIPVHNYKIMETYPHDQASYTEGLVMENGVVYEGTGLYGRSKLRQWELRSGRILNEVNLDPEYFGEGVALLGSAIYQLTYIENTGFIYDQGTLQRKGSFRYLTQGWGLTSDGKQLLMSNGSSAILLLDPRSLEVERRIFVSDHIGPVGFLNELEYADGKLFANVWQTNFIAIINPASGNVIGWIDLTGLNPDPTKLVYPFVLNGIASFNKDTGRLLVTGKCWPNVYEIELVARAPL
jgi:glutamine cyclotransferase